MDKIISGKRHIIPTKTPAEKAHELVGDDYTPKPESELGRLYQRLHLSRPLLLEKIVELAITEGYGYCAVSTPVPIRGDLPKKPIVHPELWMTMDREVRHIDCNQGQDCAPPLRASDKIAVAHLHFIYSAIEALRIGSLAADERALPAQQEKPGMPHNLIAYLPPHSDPVHMQTRLNR